MYYTHYQELLGMMFQFNHALLRGISNYLISTQMVG